MACIEGAARFYQKPEGFGVTNTPTAWFARAASLHRAMDELTELRRESDPIPNGQSLSGNKGSSQRTV